MDGFSQYKPKIAMDISTLGKGGGPYTSTKRIMDSVLSDDFSFHEIVYDPAIGRGISLKRILDIKRQIIAIQPDIVHFTGLQLSGFHMAVACWLAGVRRTVVTIRGSSADAIEFSPLKRFMLRMLLEPFTLLLSKKIIGVSDFVTNTKVPRFFAKKIYGTVYNFPPLKDANNHKNKVTRKSLGLSENDIVVITVGRVNREKGLHILESAIEKIGIADRLKFLIVGEGQYLVQMKSNLAALERANQVKFLGYRDDIRDLNNISDIFVLPTLHETLSNALLEASCSSLPLIASETGGVPEIVESGFNGILVEPGNPLQLANAIETLRDDPLRRAEYGRNAYEKIDKKFSSEEIVSRLRALYFELLGS